MLKEAIAASAFLALAAMLPSQEKKSVQGKQAKTYAVIVNSKNQCKSKDDKAKAVVKKLYLKQLSQWPDGTSAKPYGRKDATVEQVQFVKSVLAMGDAELVRHWIKMKNMKGVTPPKGVRSSRMLFKYVAKHKGAFGIVKLADIKAQKGIKVLYEF